VQAALQWYAAIREDAACLSTPSACKSEVLQPLVIRKQQDVPLQVACALPNAGSTGGSVSEELLRSMDVIRLYSVPPSPSPLTVKACMLAKFAQSAQQR
jgi:hypothetical protein